MTGPSFYSRGNLSRSPAQGQSRQLSRPVTSKSVSRLSQKSRISGKSQANFNKETEISKAYHEKANERAEVNDNLSVIEKDCRPLSKGSRIFSKESRPGTRVSYKSVHSGKSIKSKNCLPADTLIETTANNPGFANRNDSQTCKGQNDRIILKSKNSRLKDNTSEASNISQTSQITKSSNLSRPVKRPNLNNSSKASQNSDLWDQEEKSLHVYIKELESLLRKEKFKRIQSEELLKKYKTNDPLVSNQLFPPEKP